MKLRLFVVASLLLGSCAKESQTQGAAPKGVSQEKAASGLYDEEASASAAAPMQEAPVPGRFAYRPEPMPSGASAPTPTMPMAPPLAVVALPTGGAAEGYVTDTTVAVDGLARAGQQGDGGGGKNLQDGQVALGLSKESAAPGTGAFAGDIDMGDDSGKRRQATSRDQERNKGGVESQKDRPKVGKPRPTGDESGWNAPVDPAPVAEPVSAAAAMQAPDKPAEKIVAARGPTGDASAVVVGTLTSDNGAFEARVVADKKGALDSAEGVEEEVDDEVAEGESGEKAKEDKRGGAERRSSRLRGNRGEVRRRPVAQRPSERPTSFLPDFFYFENTYLGGDAGYRESLRRLDRALADVGAPHRLSRLPDQAFDAPVRDGLGLLATATGAMTDGPGRVFLQVGLRGSDRHGWRRPPLELVVVLDSARLGDATTDVVTFIETVLERLGPQDRVAIVASGQSAPVATLGGLRQHRSELLPRLEQVLRAIPATGTLAEAMTRAGWIFVEASRARTTAPGTQVALLFTRSDRSPGDVAAQAAPVASQLALGGVVTSVVGLSGSVDDAALWTIAAAGHGNAHTAVAGQKDSVVATVDAELELLSRVVARLVRVNVKLAPGVKAIRVLGSRPLLDDEVRVVKAREVETDRRLSQVLGITADRGDDDDGIQTVIPVFYGGDSHVVVLELWAENAGPVADVTLRYKDMVNLDNRSARTSVSVRGHGRDAEQEDPLLASTRDAMVVGDALRNAASSARSGDLGTAIGTLDHNPGAISGTYGNLLRSAARGEVNTSAVVESLELAARRAVGGGG